MKKILIMTVLCVLSSTMAFAAGTLDMSFTSTGKTLTGAKSSSGATTVLGKTSTGVGVGVNSVAAGYAIVTQHKNGTKIYGTSFDSTSMYSKDVATKGIVELARPSDQTTASFSSWSTL